MKHLNIIFSLLQYSRHQTQYGYILSGIPKHAISDLAQHHYLVSFIGWQLTRLAQKKGAKLDMERILELCLIHDVGEMFGSDIAMPYGRANPAARKAAKTFEVENHKYIAELFQEEEQYVTDLFEELFAEKTDESLVAKIADYTELIYFKETIREQTEGDITMMINRMNEFIDNMSDEKVKEFFTEYVDYWPKALKEGSFKDLMEEAKFK